MSTRKNSTEKAPKAKKAKKQKVKEPKAKKKKDKKQKAKKGENIAEDAVQESPFGAPQRAPKVRKVQPKAPKDVYTLILLISFLFFIMATVLIYLDLASYK
ncbi:MAG: hypothetical protein ACOX0A_03760 [Thermoguttaceae bacterium]|jgi:phage portal protein BeeE